MEVGQRLTGPQKTLVLSRVAELMGTRGDRFPGAQPVSFTRDHISLLKSADFYVCEKSDGVRYLLLLTRVGDGGAAYFIDRKHEVFHCSAFFPSAEDMRLPVNDSLFDGELLRENNRFVFAIFDCMAVNGRSVMRESLRKRLSYANDALAAPFKRMQQEFPDFVQKQPFSVELKQMHKAYGVTEIFDQVIPALAHENDGLIFTPVQDPYTCFTCNRMLKWKPAELNTIDFLLQRSDDKVDLFLYDNGQPTFFDTLFMDEHTKEELRMNPQMRIAECSFVSGQGWTLMRFRDDKDTPNDERVAHSILRSISECVTADELKRAMPEIRARWKSREANKLR